MAYLVTLYPKVSHTFIAREIAGLREVGVEVTTFSVRRPPPEEILSASDQVESGTTTVLVGSTQEVLATVLKFVLRHPVAFCAGLRQALNTGRPGLRSRIWQIFYLLESIPLVCAMSARNLRHVHVHLANNSADIARLGVCIGSIATGERWSWSLAMHGPTEFSDVEKFDLKTKVESALFVACITDYCRSQLMALTDTSHWAKLHIVRMGIDTAQYGFVDRSGRHHRTLRVLFVGRLVPEKAPQLLVEAITQLPEHSVDLRLVGNGPLREPLESLALDLANRASIEVVGAVGQDDLLPHYEWADLFCLPSFAEGLPVVIMEAMATGLPVIATAIAGIPELVANGQTGTLISAGRADLIASAIDELRAADVRDAIGARASAAVRPRHEAKHNARALSALFASYIEVD